jgi:hypothetical protein
MFCNGYNYATKLALYPQTEEVEEEEEETYF